MCATPTAAVLERGRAFFDKCYGKVAGRVMTSLDHSGTEDLGLAVRLTYGYVLSTTAVLSEAETSFVMIAGLIPQDVRIPFSPSPSPLRPCNLSPVVRSGLELQCQPASQSASLAVRQQ